MAPSQALGWGAPLPATPLFIGFFNPGSTNGLNFCLFGPSGKTQSWWVPRCGAG